MRGKKQSRHRGLHHNGGTQKTKIDEVVPRVFKCSTTELQTPNAPARVSDGIRTHDHWSAIHGLKDGSRPLYREVKPECQQYAKKTTQLGCNAASFVSWLKSNLS